MEQAKVVEEKTIGTSVAEFRPFEASLAEYVGKYKDVVYDIDDPAQERQARSDSYQISTVCADLKRAHAAVKKPLLEQCRVLDGEYNRIDNELRGVQIGIKQQIEAKEARLQAIEDALEARVQAIRGLLIFPSAIVTSDQVFERILDLGILVIDESFSHREADAVQAKAEVTEQLNTLFEKIALQESDAAELARLREETARREQQDRERKIAEEAVERDRLKREETERQQRETQERAIRQSEEARIAAEKRTEEAEARAAKAAEDAIELERKQQREIEEQERIDREAREADEAHRQLIRTEACARLSSLFGMDDELVAGVFEAIDTGEIPHIKIEY